MIRVRCWILLSMALASWGAAAQPATPPSDTFVTQEPITPLLARQAATPQAALGERLFYDVRLSRDRNKSCNTCHNLATNGATPAVLDVANDGSPLEFNTTSIFNTGLNPRIGWRGNFRTLEAQAAALLQNPAIMNISLEEAVARIAADRDLAREFKAAYGRGPDRENLLDAIASFERTLVTPSSRFDHWLMGDATALSTQEQSGYRTFKLLGCAACHQGVNVGGNLLQRHGIFRPLVKSGPPVVRVPSLRNVAVTAPYFHDGSAATLEGAVMRMAASQLNSTLTQEQVQDITAFLRTLTGSYRGRTLQAPR